MLPNPSPHHHHHNQVHQVEVNNPGQVTNSEILKSIQSITEVMQQQLLLNSKTTKQGIVQTASLFQEMITAQEKRDLDPVLLVIPTFSGEAKDMSGYHADTPITIKAEPSIWPTAPFINIHEHPL